MNDRFFKDTITIYNQKEDESFQRTVVDKVYVRKTRKTILDTNGEQLAGNCTIIIPTAIAEVENQLAIKSYIDNKSINKNSAILNFTLNAKLIDHAWTLRDGDYIVDSKCNLDFDMTKIRKEHRLFRIESVADNRKGDLQHFKIEVME